MPRSAKKAPKPKAKKSIAKPAVKPSQARTVLSESEKLFKKMHKNSAPDSYGAFLYRLFALSQVAALITDAQGNVLFANDHFLHSCRMRHANLIGKSLSILDRKLSSGVFFKSLVRHFSQGLEQAQTLPFPSCDCATFGNHATITPLSDTRGKIRHYSIIFKDITGQKRSEKLIHYMNNHDSLTDLPNRSLFNQRLTQAMAAAADRGQKLAVMILGLDRFKVINNTLGHTAGDQVIQDVGKRLLENIQPVDTIARMGGDEFLLLLPEARSFQDISRKAQSILGSFAKPFQFQKQEIFIKASIGISIFPEDGEDHQTLLKNADAALNEAKRSGRNNAKFYTAKLDATATEEFTIETALRRALDHGELTLHYQPQVSFETGKVLGMEALVRWKHPQRGLIPPDKFIPLAEETGLIVPMGQWILETACRQVLEWHAQGFPSLRVAVNLSARQFQEPELVEAVLAVCQRTGLDPRFLELEITESIFMNDLNITKMILQWLSKKGITIAIDDFGTGYSSLTYLKQLPIHTLKIDRSFVKDCLTNADDAAIVSTIASIAKNLNMKITAEGVEEEPQIAFLRGLGCHDFQGYFFSRPLPASEFTELLLSGRSLYGHGL